MVTCDYLAVNNKKVNFLSNRKNRVCKSSKDVSLLFNINQLSPWLSR